jgi:hypothetical protein
MVIGAIQGSLYYDYYSERDHLEREMHYRRQESVLAQQQMAYNPYGGAIAGGHHAEQQRQVAVVDPKDPLSFLSKADNKLLLTGEAP